MVSLLKILRSNARVIRAMKQAKDRNAFLGRAWEATLAGASAAHELAGAGKRLIVPEIPRNILDVLQERERDAEAVGVYQKTYAGYLAQRRPRVGAARQRLGERLAAGERLRVLLLNDNGFQYGAGVALRRQAAALLLLGLEVSAASFLPAGKQNPVVTGIPPFEGWRGTTKLRDYFKVVGNAGAGKALGAKIAQLNPDAVIVGNLHSVANPLQTLDALSATGIPVFVYMHDAFWVTGRCAAPLACTKYLTGCDSSCPTAHEFPRLQPDLIRQAWADREQLFTRPNGIALIANSSWTLELARQRYGGKARAEIVHLGLDHAAFAPFPKALARQLLGVPEGRTVVVMGAVDVSDRWKGGAIFEGVLEALTGRHDVHVVLFGHASTRFRAAKSFGFVSDERLMALILSTADIFVSTAIAESFGQTLLEASACGFATVALDVGGVRDIVVHEETGLLVREQSVAAVLGAVDQLIKDQQKREGFGRAGRRRVEEHFTLIRQAEAWCDCLARRG
jgi:Glycosyl transferases group 1